MTQEADISDAINAAKHAFQRRLGGGVIVIDEDSSAGKNTIGIEFFGPHEQGIMVEFVQSTNIQGAEAFLRGETLEKIQFNPQVFKAFLDRLMNNSQSKGLTDIGSGCLMYSGVLK
eukprot:CAMPEP_0202495074 /NCGR_PEP_ID=MMETSP1361-20130828/15032_1 /ASSEMBLY_ACC=CAM_ASM_000849 /TAXON_ID=210615 /ORGANISM="Staurosira complex sp., Strain CCMP2646" /LENGTH=115 /DNA_ID=CAMNT_0049125935 /DNA_START=56 /DNA_END=404 /DNA_ORIENTATION=-